MLDTILGALLPMVVTFLLGYMAAWRHDFGSKDASTLNRMVLRYAVPLALFAGTVMTSRAVLGQDVPLIITLCVAIIGFYCVVFLISRFIFRMQMSTSALAALTASAPAVPFVGPAVLGDLLGGLSAIPIAAASLVINLTVVPITILLLSLDSTERGQQNNTPVSGEQENSSRHRDQTPRFSLGKSPKLLKSRWYGRRFSLSLSCSAVSASLSCSCTLFPCLVTHPEASRFLPAESCLHPARSKSTETSCSSYS
jgi:predicted permease